MQTTNAITPNTSEGAKLVRIVSVHVNDRAMSAITLPRPPKTPTGRPSEAVCCSLR